MVHRDLKPANVKVTPDGVVKLLDFGLAKAYSDQPDAASGDPEVSPTVTLGATVAGTVMGTAAYMAPEQAKGQRVDRRADIWSWGVVLYELLTGERLFKGDEAADALAQVLTKEPDWDRAPVRVQLLLRRCLEKDPKQRLRDIGEARHLLDKSPSPPEPVTAPKRSWLAWTTAAMLAVAAAGVAALWLRPAPLPQVMRFEIHAPSGSTLPLGTPAISPDGRTIAFTVTDPGGKTRIYVHSIDRIETRALPGTEGAVHPFWSPDGRSLAFVALPEFHLKRIDVAHPIAVRIAGGERRRKRGIGGESVMRPPAFEEIANLFLLQWRPQRRTPQMQVAPIVDIRANLLLFGKGVTRNMERICLSVRIRQQALVGALFGKTGDIGLEFLKYVGNRFDPDHIYIEEIV